VSPLLALLLALLAVQGLIFLVLGRSPLPWSRRREEPHWIRAWGGFAVLLAAGVAAYEAFHAVAATYVLLVAAFVPPLLATIEDNRRARR
jgi:drug/metabolite transporter (DMT)-like permease